MVLGNETIIVVRSHTLHSMRGCGLEVTRYNIGFDCSHDVYSSAGIPNIMSSGRHGSCPNIRLNGVGYLTYREVSIYGHEYLIESCLDDISII